MPVSQHARLLLRAAQRIHDRLTRSDDPSVPALPTDNWDEFRRLADRMWAADERGWKAAARMLRSDAAYCVRRLKRRLDEWSDGLPADRDEQPIASLRDVHADLVALYQEFPDVQIDLRENAISVETESIFLEEIDLGRFEIRLEWDDLGEESSYGVVALDADSSESDIAHPHVRDETLCEGEGKTPIANALQSGRIFDFFVLVRQVLQTYNAGSAYAPLNCWHGIECHDCGDTAAEVDATRCELCGYELCCDCSCDCVGCGKTCCSECRTACSGCDEYACNFCLSACRECGERVCTNCLDAGLCDDCRNQETEPDAGDPSTTIPTDATPQAADLPAADAAVHAEGVGEAALSARPGRHRSGRVRARG